MTADKNINSSRRIYASLLRLYPPEFRDEYGPSMLQLFTDQCRWTLQENGPRGMAFLWVRTLMDLVFSVLREHITSSTAAGALLEAVPNKPLPWKGVAVVLIPCLVFFIGQIGQLAGQDWFDLLIRRAAYYLILPVLLVWLLTRKFPVWGLIPLGMFFRNVMDLSSSVKYVVGKTSVMITGVADTLFVEQFTAFWGSHITETEILVVTFLLGTAIFLILRMARRRGFTRPAWVWTGLFLLLILGEQFHSFISLVTDYKLNVSEGTGYQEIPFILRNIASTIYSNAAPEIGFFLLILIGGLMARHHGRLALLLPLGYLIPTVVMGYVDDWPNLPYSLFWISASVLAYRVLVTLVAPIWIVRSSSEHAQQRAGTIVLLAALGINVAAHALYLSASLAAYGDRISRLDYYSYFSPELLILAGIALAITLYQPVNPAQPIPGAAQIVVGPIGDQH
jgi:hypothetical protein